MNEERLILALAIHRAFGLKSREKERVFEAVRTPDEYSRFSLDDLAVCSKRPLSFRSWSSRESLDAAERDYRICRALDIRPVGVWEAGYPPLLRETWDPPFMVFVRGRAPDPDKPALAAVGTRSADNEALNAAWRLGFDAGKNAIPLISGLAAGVDSAAHRGAVDCRVPTFAILGCGIDSVYPAAHRTLAARMIDSGGGLLSEYPPGFPALRHHFPERNRIIAGLARWVAIIQAPRRSGALITAEYALDCGRDLVVHAVGVRDGEQNDGTRALAGDGAPVISCCGDLPGIAPEFAEGPRAEDEQPAVSGGGSGKSAHTSDVAALLARRLDRELGLREKEPAYGT
ncbi:MAG: DNA-processing protein DprA [Spirochaetales bacterium]